MVGVLAALEGKAGLSLGNVIGSNIANLSLIMGGAAMLSGTLRASDEFIKRHVYYVFLIGSLPMLLMIDQKITRIDGLILIIIYFLYVIGEMKSGRHPIKRMNEGQWWHKAIVVLSRARVKRGMLMLIGGVLGVLISAEVIVRCSGLLANMLGIPVLIVGLFLVAVGTSLPELAFGMVAIRKHEAAMALGNVFGSVVVNATLVLGLTALIQPIALNGGLVPYLVASIAFIVIFFIFWWLIWTKHRLERWEGAFLVVIYAIFAYLELLLTGHK
jgi:cation:H+ antiporter